jgi:hypothetical protein
MLADRGATASRQIDPFYIVWFLFQNPNYYLQISIIFFAYIYTDKPSMYSGIYIGILKENKQRRSETHVFHNTKGIK